MTDFKLPQSSLDQYVASASDEIKKQSQLQNERWNRDAEEANQSFRPSIEESIRWLLPKQKPFTEFPKELQDTLWRFGIADSLALRLKADLTRTTWHVVLLAFFGMVCLEIGHALGHISEDWAKLPSYVALSCFFILWWVAIYSPSLRPLP